MLLVLPLLVGADRCGGSEGSDEPTPFDCEIGLLDPDGVFVPIGTDTTVELLLGFQGFLIVEFVARTDDHRVSGVVEGAVTLTPQDMDPIGNSGMYVEFARDGEWEVTTPIQIFLDPGQLATYTGRTAHLALRLEGGDRACVVQEDVLLVDDDPCIHTGAEPICPGDDTGTPQ